MSEDELYDDEYHDDDDDDDSNRDGRGQGVDGMGPVGEEESQVSERATVATPARDQGGEGEGRAVSSPGLGLVDVLLIAFWRSKIVQNFGSSNFEFRSTVLESTSFPFDPCIF